MFKELKRKFVIINMSLLTFVFVAIFSAIFTLTVYSGEREIDFTLNRIINSPPKPFPREPRLVSSMLVEVKNNKEIIVFPSLMNVEEDFIKEAVNKAIEIDSDKGKINIEAFSFSFLKKSTPMGTRIAFVDRSHLQRSLRNILVIFILVTGLSLIVLFLLSLYFANKSINPIKEAFEKQKEFIANASHELKTPLTIIKTNMDVICENQEEKVKSQQKWIGFIYNQIDIMANLINDMISLARLDSLKENLVFCNFNLSNALEGVLLSFEAAFYENSIKLETDIQENVYIHGDRDSLERLITILIDNAIKNTPKNGIITVSLSAKKNNIEIIVKNTGKGIAPENMERVFERFYREDSSQTTEKSSFGLGLAIAKSIVENHNGKIYVESEPNVYTSFIVKLPVANRS